MRRRVFEADWLIAYRCLECGRLRPAHQPHDTSARVKGCAWHGRDRLPRCVRVELVPSDELKAAVSAAFKRGVQFRETTNAPTPSDEEIAAKLDRGSVVPSERGAGDAVNGVGEPATPQSTSPAREASVCPTCGLPVVTFENRLDEGPKCSPIQSPECWRKTPLVDPADTPFQMPEGSS